MAVESQAAEYERYPSPFIREEQAAVASPPPSFHGLHEGAVSEEKQESGAPAPSPPTTLDFSDVDGAESRGLIPSDGFPVPAEHHAAFKRFVLDFDWEDTYLLHVRSSNARKLVLRDLMERLGASARPVSHLDAEKMLQLSYLVHQRFVAGDEGVPVEHLGIARAVGQVLLTGSFNEEASTSGGNAPAPPRVLERVPVPVVLQGNAEGRTQQESIACYLESLAADLRSRRVADRTSETSNLALDRVIDIICTHLPTNLAEQTVKCLIEANDALRGGDGNLKQDGTMPTTSRTRVPGSKSAQLGHSYRIGALAAEERRQAYLMNQVGARAVTADAPEDRSWPFGRAARRSPTESKLLSTLNKAIEGRGEFTHLNSKQKLRAMARLVRRQLHEAELESDPALAATDDNLPGQSDLPPTQNSSNGARCGPGQGVTPERPTDASCENSNSEGDSCGGSNESRDSRESDETYQRDSFCGSDVRSAADTGSVDDASSLDERDRKRAEQRRESVNSLGTPTARKRYSGAPQAPVLKPVEGDRPSLVLLGDEDLTLWKSGPAKFKMGFHWESYLHHKQQYDNYKAHRGRYSDRTFKSVIDAKLVPTVCSSCGFARAKWANVSDARLILRIERVLRPSRSTDFAMELKEILLERHGSEPLQASYVTFAEKFLAKLAEAADAGRPVKPVVVKAAFKSAVSRELPLMTWLEGDKWRGVDHAHKRLLRKLREARSWEAMSLSVKKRHHRAEDTADDSAHNDQREPRPKSQYRRLSDLVKMGRLKTRGVSPGKHRVNAGATAARGDRRQNEPGVMVRTWRGCDSRGDSWHTDKDLFECYKRPCQMTFCQRCARHGHTANFCRVPEGTEGLNASGYFQEQRPGKAGPKRLPQRSNSSGKRNGGLSDSSGCESDGDASRNGNEGSSRGNTSRRMNSNRGRSGRGRL